MSSSTSARPELDLTSTANTRVKALLGLRRKRSREQVGLTIVEGREELLLALDAGSRPHALYYCPDLIRGQDADAVTERVVALGGEVVRVNRQIFEKVSYRESPDGWLATVPVVDDSLGLLRLSGLPVVLVCESVEKPGNLGAMLRTADAAGADAVIAADPVTDWGNPNIVRASKGTVFSVPVASASTVETLDWLHERSIPLVVTTPDADALYTDADYRGPIAIVVGAEKHGVSAPCFDRADQRVRIPMRGRADSLNVATSAALLLYEVLRQRTAASTG